MIFVDSVSDFFHEKIPFSFTDRAVQVMRETPRHIYQIPTKRTHTMLEYQKHMENDLSLKWPDNVWMLVSVGSKDMLWKIEDLRKMHVKVRGLSCEPLVEPIVPPLDLSGIGWVIVGGMSGRHWREHIMDLDWARKIRDLCIKNKVPFFFKQVSGYLPGTNPYLDGKLWHQFPKTK
jgi:protein gp37